MVRLIDRGEVAKGKTPSGQVDVEGFNLCGGRRRMKESAMERVMEGRKPAGSHFLLVLPRVGSRLDTLPWAKLPRSFNFFNSQALINTSKMQE